MSPQRLSATAAMPHKPRRIRWNDYRTVLGEDYRTVICLVGFQAGSIAHILRDGAQATLCGIQRPLLARFEDLDEPVCPKCIAQHARIEVESPTGS